MKNLTWANTCNVFKPSVLVTSVAFHCVAGDSLSVPSGYHTYPAASHSFIYHFGNHQINCWFFWIPAALWLSLLCCALSCSEVFKSPPVGEILESRNLWDHLSIYYNSRVLRTWKTLIKQLAKQKKLICEMFNALCFWVHISRKIICFFKYYLFAMSLQSCLTLCNLMDYSLPGFSVHGILTARILEWVAMPSWRGSSPPRYWTCVSYVSCTDRWVLYH